MILYKAFQRHWSKTCQSFKTKYSIITGDALVNDMERRTLQNLCIQVFNV